MSKISAVIAKLTIPAILFAASCLASKAAQAQNTGFVYVATNAPLNTVIQYSRAGNGSLTKIHEIATGGSGATGNGAGLLDPLGSQDSLVLTGSGSLILVANAGTNSVSSIGVTSTGLHLVSVVFSGGVFPNSIAVNGTLVYVLNARGTAGIAGFRLNMGVLTAIPGSSRALPGGELSAPHDIRFSPDGTRLIVTEGGANKIDVFPLDSSGLATGVASENSAGSGPFALRFGRLGTLLESEANSGSVSSYILSAQDTLDVISVSVADGGLASCWITLTGDGKFAFVSNTGSGTISTYQVSGNGAVNLALPIAAILPNGAPIDSALSSDGNFLYVIDSAQGRIVSFRVAGASLHPLSFISGLPGTLQGIAAQ